MRREQQQKYIYFFHVIRYGYTYTFYCVHRFYESINSYKNRSKIQLRMKQITQEISAEQTSIESKLEISLVWIKIPSITEHMPENISQAYLLLQIRKKEKLSLHEICIGLYMMHISTYIYNVTTAF